MMTPSRFQRAFFGAVLLAFAAWPAAAPAAREDRELDETMKKGRAALEDQLYDVAEKHFQRYIRKSRTDEERGRGTMYLARTLHAAGRYRDALSRLEGAAFTGLSPGVEAGLLFWRARTLHDLGRDEDVLPLADEFESRFPDDARIRQMKRLHIQAFLKTSREAEAFRAFEQFQEQYAQSEEAPGILLDWAEALEAAGDRASALNLLRRLRAEYPKTAQSLEARARMSQYLMEDQAWSEAQEVLSELVDLGPPEPLRSSAWHMLARVYEAQTNLTQALTALYRVARAEKDEARLTDLNHELGLLLVRIGKVDEGNALANQAVAQMASRSTEAAAEAQLEHADLLLELGLHEWAAEQYQHYLDAFSDEAGRARALLGRGWSLWNLRRYAEAAALFEKSYALHPDPAGREEALVKAADARFAEGQYEAARTLYAKAAAEFPQSLQASQSLYQGAEARARLRDVAGAVAEFNTLITTYSNSVPAEQALFRLVRLYEENNQLETAIATCDRILRMYPGNLRVATRATHARGLLRYRLGQFPQAMEDFEQVVKSARDGALAEQAFYMRGWCLYLLGEDEQALAICRRFLEQFPNSSWSADVQFWLGEFYFNQARFAEAEPYFTRLTESYPQSPLAGDALFWAGRSAAEQKEFVRAIEHYGKLSKNYPAHPRLAESRFAQGDALSELGEFSSAILAFEEVIKRFSDSYLVEAAWGRIGDCHFALAATDRNRYGPAMAAYRQVLDRPRASMDMRMQAEYKLGRCYEKMGDNKQAFEQYMSVVYRYFIEMEKGTPPGPLWFTRAAFGAAAIQETARNWDQAVQIYRRVEEAGVPAAPDAAHRIEKIQAERAPAPEPPPAAHSDTRPPAPEPRHA